MSTPQTGHIYLTAAQGQLEKLCGLNPNPFICIIPYGPWGTPPCTKDPYEVVKPLTWFEDGLDDKTFNYEFLEISKLGKLLTIVGLIVDDEASYAGSFWV